MIPVECENVDVLVQQLNTHGIIAFGNFVDGITKTVKKK